MKDAKLVGVPLGSHFNLWKMDLSENEVKELEKILYASWMGSLVYVMVCTRPDIVHTVVSVSRFLANLGNGHLQVAKWRMRYLRDTSKLALCFGGNKQLLVGYTDADMVADVDTWRSTSRFVVTFVSGLVS